MRPLKIFLGGMVLLGSLAACSTGDTPTHLPEALYATTPAAYSYIAGEITPGAPPSHAYHADLYITPASCQKVVTALLALKILGPEYRFTTRLYTNTTPSSSKHHSIKQAWIRASGDPRLTFQQLLLLLEPLQHHSIQDGLVLDMSLFQVPAYSPNLIADDQNTSYAPPVSSMVLDKNLLQIDAVPTQVGMPAVLTNDAFYPMAGTVITELNTPSQLKAVWDGSNLSVHGSIQPQDRLVSKVVAPPSVDLYLYHKLQKALALLHIHAKIHIIHQPAPLPEGMKLAGQVQSEPLSHTLPDALNRSDNGVFDALYLTVIQHYTREALNKWEDGNAVIHQLVQAYFGVELHDALVVDGSGLSRYNRIQPRSLFELLRQGYDAPGFVEALPYPGKPLGTLAKRTHLPSTIRAKTGGMLGISCLCGYDLAPATPLVWVMSAQGFAPPMQALFPTMDGFVSRTLLGHASPAISAP